MAKPKNIDHLFKEGLEDYKAKPDSHLEAKMAAMIGITGAAAASGSVAATTATTAANGGAGAGLGTAGTTTAVTGSAGAGLGTTAVIAKGGLIAKCSALLKVATIKGAAILKTLGVIKTVGTIAVIGTVTTATVVVSEEIIENKKQAEIHTKATQTEEASNRSILLISALEIDEITGLLEAKEMAMSQWLFMPEEEERLAISKIQAQEYYELEYENQATYLLPKDVLAKEKSLEKEMKTSSSSLSSSNTVAIKGTSYKSVVEEDAVDEDNPLPEGISPQAPQELELHSNDPSILNKKGMILNAGPLMAPKMNSLEKGLYLPNYKIQGEFYLMPMMYSHLLQAQINNDTATDHQISQKPQFSYQIGAGIRIQKKRKPWFLQLGINYQHLKEEVDLSFKREYIDHDQSSWNIDTVYNYFINPPVIDSNIQSIDSAYMAYWATSEEGKKATNTYQFLEVPLRLGYQYHKYGKNWSMEASTGVSFAFHLKSTGYTYDNGGHIINYQDTKSTPKVYCYYLAHVGFNYHLNSMTLFAEPSLKYQLNKKKVENSPYESRYLLYGLKLGIRIQLFKNGGQP